jgi:hydroxymethylpyrimidine/phosphomethylpyrimidine kinase
LHEGDRVTELAGERIPGGDVRGTGCALSSAIAAQLAQGHALAEAIALARAYVRAKIAGARTVGRMRVLP